MTRTITLTPNGTVSSDWARTGGSTQHGVVTDGSGSTYITGDTGFVQIAQFDLSTVPLSGVVGAIRVGLTHETINAVNNNEIYEAYVAKADNTLVASETVAVPAGSTAEEVALPFVWDGVVTQSVLDGLRLGLNAYADPLGGGTGDWRIYECYVELDIEDNPVGSVPLGF